MMVALVKVVVAEMTRNARIWDMCRRIDPVELDEL